MFRNDKSALFVRSDSLRFGEKEIDEMLAFLGVELGQRIGPGGDGAEPVVRHGAQTGAIGLGDEPEWRRLFRAPGNRDGGAIFPVERVADPPGKNRVRGKMRIHGREWS